MNWTTISEMVDITTGEKIQYEQLVTKEYLIIDKTLTKTTFNEKRTKGTRHYIWRCKRNNQTELF